MATIDELFATMTEETTTSAIDELLIIDPNTRQISLPGAELVFGVEGDAGSERKYFLCPRIVGNNLDLASSFVRVVYRNANGEEDAYPVTDVTLNDSGDAVMFSWELMGKVTRYKGQVKFLVYAVGPDLKTKWHTTLATGISLEGLTPDTSSIETETADVVAQLIAMVEAQTVAVESVGAEQVANVQTEGATQVSNVKKAASEAQDIAVGQIEAKGTEVLASIPDDYTTVSQKVNGQANAIIGKVSGEVVRVDDVSPIEHTMGVRVRPKNLFNIGVLEPMPANYTTRISAVDIENNTVTITTDDTHTGNGYCGLTNGEGNYVLTLRDLCPHMVAGKTYTLSGNSDSRTKTLYLRGVNISWVFGRSLTITEDHLNAKIALYGLDSAGGEGTGDCVISNVQIEEGIVATDYTPYIDPTTVTLTGCGKNLFKVAGKTQSHNGVTFTVNDDGSVSVTGTATKATFMGLGALKIKPGEKYRVSGSPTGSAFDTYMLYIHNNTTGSDTYDLGEGRVFTGKEGDLGVTIAVYAGTTVNNLTFYPMVVLGEGSENFEPYNGTTISPTSDGTVAGLTSLSPTMTLLTDKAGVTVECEYNRDTNKVIAELLNKIAELSA